METKHFILCPASKYANTGAPNMTSSDPEPVSNGPVQANGAIPMPQSSREITPVFPSAVLAVILFLALCGTTRWLSLEEAFRDEKATDIETYLAIARAAPSLPPAGAQLVFHHAQRFASPYLVGLVAWCTHLPPEQVFRAAVFVTIALIVWVAYGILRHLRVPEPYGTLCLALLILHPYTFRLYIAIPPMMDDLVFVLGLSLLVYGLLKGRLGKSLMAALISTLGKQTALFVLPVIALWIFFGPPWSRLSLGKRATGLFLITLVMLTCYFVTASVAARFSGPSLGVYFMLTGLARWMRSDFNAVTLANFLFKSVFPFLFPLAIGGALLCRTRPRLPREFYLLLAVVIAVCSQPLLGGPNPAITGVNVLGITRLNLLAYVPLLAALGLVFREARLPAQSGSLMMVCGILVAVSSLHPRYIYNGVAKGGGGAMIMGTAESTASMVFVCIYGASALLLAVAMYLSAARSPSPKLPPSE
jgi:hypothetical protein